jgi:apolipoprotein D and lipocalin family protein
MGIQPINPPKTKIELEEIHDINIEKFLGDWFEVARIEGPHKFESDCFGGMAHYEYLGNNDPNKRFRVINNCIVNNKTIRKQMGYIDVIDKGRLLIVMDNTPVFITDSQRKQGGNYWIIDFEENNYAVISSPDCEYLWVLARYPIEFVETDTFKKIIQKIKNDKRFSIHLKIIRVNNYKKFFEMYPS